MCFKMRVRRLPHSLGSRLTKEPTLTVIPRWRPLNPGLFSSVRALPQMRSAQLPNLSARNPLGGWLYTNNPLYLRSVSQFFKKGCYVFHFLHPEKAEFIINSILEIYFRAGKLKGLLKPKNSVAYRIMHILVQSRPMEWPFLWQYLQFLV